MPPLVIPECVRTTHVYQLNGVDYAVNVIHYKVGAGVVVSGATASDYGADVQGALNLSTLYANWPTNVSLDRVTVRDLRTANQPEFQGTVGQAGTGTGAFLPPQTSLVCTLRTAKAGKSFRGRIYLPGWSEDANDVNGQVKNATVADAKAFVDDLLNVTVQGNVWTMGVMSPTLGQINPVSSGVFRDQIWDTQRRRAYPGI